MPQSCVFVTGHLKDGTMNLDWEGLARPRQTVVIYMGLGGLAGICAQLVAHGAARQPGQLPWYSKAPRSTSGWSAAPWPTWLRALRRQACDHPA